MKITKKEAQELVEHLKQTLVKAEELSKESSSDVAKQYAFKAGYLEGVIKSTIINLGGSL